MSCVEDRECSTKGKLIKHAESLSERGGMFWTLPLEMTLFSGMSHSSFWWGGGGMRAQ